MFVLVVTLGCDFVLVDVDVCKLATLNTSMVLYGDGYCVGVSHL